MLAVNEIFGPTVQGEGPSIGHRCFFVRLAGCNLTCRTCDTPYTWAYSSRLADLHVSKILYDRSQESHAMTSKEVFDTLMTLGLDGHDILVISGGEPLLQREGLLDLLSVLFKPSRWEGRIEIETNGTIDPTQLSFERLRFNVSPKLSAFGVGMSETVRLVPRSISVFSHFADHDHAIFKFVVVTPSDLEEVADLQSQYQIPSRSIYIMPEGVDQVAIINRQQLLADEVIQRGWNLTTRLHISLWGQRRGV